MWPGKWKKVLIVRDVRQDEVRVAKHYIMTHPEKFVQPERIKFGDRRCFLDWTPCRNT